MGGMGGGAFGIDLGEMGRKPDPFSPKKGKDVSTSVTLSFMESVMGCEKEFSISMLTECDSCKGVGAKSIRTCQSCNGQGTRSQRLHRNTYMQTECDPCHGSGKIAADKCKKCRAQGRVQGTRSVEVTAPPGVEDSQVLRLAGMGEAGLFGGKPGNLHVKVQVTPHKMWRRQGLDIHCSAPISISQAVLGDTVKVPTVLGQELEAQVLPGTSHGDVYTLRGAGVKGRNGQAGNQVIHWHISVPKTLTSRQRELMQEFGAEEGHPGPTTPKSMIERMKRFCGLS
eukprot:gnl/Hemi2/28365_TR9374_c0_g1_i1.p1 gnl/Hemi2/28365_TR9374_c0_g1~~gnl/Hemi2/28365_TR9374_c0_g1_i1.p1  ORF type:complete len:283 (-),score=44.03 gnl/Hemi2/28365_TR9374_c0_g1_i1:25-873(-)